MGRADEFSRVKPFLTANWRYLAMLNYVVDPRIIAPLVPPGTEIDLENGETFISIVGFLFLDTRLLGLRIPLHRNFEEVNLRFYVRRKSAETWRRGVVFIRELVPRRAVALIARAFYGEHYVALPMKHTVKHVDGRVGVEYSWRRGSKSESISMTASGEAQSIPAGSHEEFISEHYWATPASAPATPKVAAETAGGPVAANTVSNIHAGKFGTPTRSSSARMLQLSTASSSWKL